MPFSYDANITDLNDAILAAVNEQVASRTSGLNTSLSTVQDEVAGLDTRVANLENSTSEPEPTPEPTPDPTPTDELVQIILTRHNEYRAARGIAPLTYSPAISQVSQNWSDYMWSTQNMVHNPDYKTQMPSGASASAENIAWTTYSGTQAAEFMMQLWIDSSVHEASIRNANYNYVGIGVKQQDGRTYSAVNFGTYATSPDDGSTPTTPTVNSYTATRTSTGIDFKANVSNITDVTLRVSASPITTQVGWYYPLTASSTGEVAVVTTAQTNTTSGYYWRLEDTADRNTVLISGEVGAFSESTPTPTPTGDMTGGSGGALTNRTFQSYTSGGITSSYHIYASGLDWTKKVGILIYGDGSGEYGLENPTQSYLMGGTSGLIAVAKKHNMILLTPQAPGTGCPDGGGVCWYATSSGITRAQKTQWSFDLIKYVYSQYNIDKSRVAVGGYSSGAQWTSQQIIPAYGPQIMSDGVFVPISYGGAPVLSTTFTTSFKNNVVGSWDCGTADSAYTSSSYGAIGGYNWYTNNGFVTENRWVSGVGHGRSGEFGTIMDREITQHVKSA